MLFYFLIYNIHTKTLFLIEYLLYLHKSGCFVNIILKGKKNKIFEKVLTCEKVRSIMSAT